MGTPKKQTTKKTVTTEKKSEVANVASDAPVIVVGTEKNKSLVTGKEYSVHPKLAANLIKKGAILKK